MTGKTVSLSFFQTRTGQRDLIEMPSATTGYRAAQRCAEFVGLDPERDDEEWQLVTHPGGDLIPPDEPIIEWDGQTVVLMSCQRR